eukprot:TRINITY_DN9750_c0_g1_i1.p1 TRINITY_DN9750_c0_g1~~TRINITY_DN9750_c0_g1_i1.p1  ORF type:complete len:609 (+),score=111.69 TRINITY_DN9750_c0_g1_i1:1-1827(+)
MRAAHLLLLLVAAGAAEEVKDHCKGDSMLIKGFDNPMYDGRWWARHPVREIAGKPTYWTGVSQLGTVWNDTAGYYLYWCDKGGGGWALGGPNVTERRDNFYNGAGHYLARKGTAGDIFERYSHWVERTADGKESSETVTTACGIQINSCEPDCMDLPIGLPLDACTPRTRCGEPDPRSGYFKIITTKSDQETWHTVTVMGFQDDKCSRSLPEPSPEYVVRQCDVCAEDFTGGSYKVPCLAISSLTAEPAEATIPVPGLLSIVVALMAVGVLVYLMYLYSKRRALNDERRRRAEIREQRNRPLLEVNRSEREAAEDAVLGGEIDPLARIRPVQERVEVYKATVGGRAGLDAWELSRRAVNYSDDPMEFAFTELVRRYPADERVLREVFHYPSDVVSEGTLSSLSQTATEDPEGLARIVEDALRASEDSRRNRLAREWEEANHIPPTVNGASLISPNHSAQTNPLAIQDHATPCRSMTITDIKVSGLPVEKAPSYRLEFHVECNAAQETRVAERPSWDDELTFEVAAAAQDEIGVEIKIMHGDAVIGVVDTAIPIAAVAMQQQRSVVASPVGVVAFSYIIHEDASADDTGMDPELAAALHKRRLEVDGGL